MPSGSGGLAGHAGSTAPALGLRDGESFAGAGPGEVGFYTYIRVDTDWDDNADTALGL